MRRYTREPTDVDEIERAELAACEAKEPMPRNVADFKDHPVYALERHLRRNEVLVPGAEPTGTVTAGSKGPVERIFRRRDVRVAYSRDKWYRAMGRVVRSGEEGVKVLPKRAKRKNRGRFDDDDSDADEDTATAEVAGGLFGDELVGTPIFMPEQTELYRAPPVVNGRVPKNKFRNIDLYVPSMVPEGGVHVAHERAAQAAHILGVDYAPALTGFHFKGRTGTAVLFGAVVPKESEEAVRATIEGLIDLDAEMERERRARIVLAMWSRFLKALRIRERIWADAGADPNQEEEENDENDESGEQEGRGDKGKETDYGRDVDGDLDMASPASEEFDMAFDDEGGGGFLIE